MSSGIHPVHLSSVVVFLYNFCQNSDSLEEKICKRQHYFGFIAQCELNLDVKFIFMNANDVTTLTFSIASGVVQEKDIRM